VWTYVGRRLLLAIPTLLGASIIVFAMVHLAPGDPIAAVMPAESSQAEIEATKRAYGFDKPLPVQYLVWLGRVAHGDLGRSIATRRPVILDVRDAFFNSLVLALSSSLVAFVGGVGLGLIAAFRQGRALDRLASLVAIIGVSVPYYWAGIILIIIFSVQLNWLPAMGAADGGGPIEYLRHMVLPTVALSLIPLGVITRVVRSAALDILNQEFVLALRAKGLVGRRVFTHVVKNAAPQIFTVLGLQFGFALGGSVLVESVFSWPGTGYLLNLAIFQRDLPVLQGVILVLATFFVLLNLVVDLVQTLVDPRIARH
jgi:peptide/nickel transport system permease protein